MSNELLPVESSNIEPAGYSEETSTLVIQFKGGTKYRYPDFSPEQWDAFRATFDGLTGSAGKHFHANIRSLACEKIDEE